jgi:hypothetical protein
LVIGVPISDLDLEVYCPNPTDDLGYGRNFVVDWDDYRKLHLPSWVETILKG